MTTNRLTPRARGLRQVGGLAEDRIWARLRGGDDDGWKVRRQHPVGRLVVDFAHLSLRLRKLESGWCSTSAPSAMCAVFTASKLGYRELIRGDMKQFLKFARQQLPLTLTVLAMAGSAFFSDWTTPLFWDVRPAELKVTLLENILALGTVFVAGGAFLVTNSDLKQARISNVKCEVFKSALKSVGDDYYDIWKNILSIWANELGFSASERISVYKHTGSAFLMLGRYSLNPQFTTRGRATYPANQGCIGEAWRSAEGTCFSNRLPDPGRSLAHYETAQNQQWNVPPDVTRDLSMKPRVIAAFCVLDATGTQRQAIVVFESTRVTTLDENKLDQFLKTKGSNQVVLMMDALKFQEPSLELAKNEGFG